VRRMTFGLIVFVAASTVAAQQPPAAPPPATQPPMTVTAAPVAPTATIADTDRNTAMTLLDRVQTVLDRAAGGKKGETVGTSGSGPEQIRVVIDRGSLDEIRAEIVQIKALLGQTPK